MATTGPEEQLPLSESEPTAFFETENATVDAVEALLAKGWYLLLPPGAWGGRPTLVSLNRGDPFRHRADWRTKKIFQVARKEIGDFELRMLTQSVLDSGKEYFDQSVLTPDTALGAVSSIVDLVLAANQLTFYLGVAVERTPREAQAASPTMEKQMENDKAQFLNSEAFYETLRAELEKEHLGEFVVIGWRTQRFATGKTEQDAFGEYQKISTEYPAYIRQIGIEDAVSFLR